MSPITGAPPSLPPSQTLYLQNLPDSKLTKFDLRTLLYALFTTYGTFLDIVALKTPKHRGQAHVVFQNIAEATSARASLQGLEVLGKKIIIQYALTKSHKIMKLEGTYKPGRKQDGPVEADSSFVAIPGQGFGNEEPEIIIKAPTKMVELVVEVKRGHNGDNVGMKAPEKKMKEDMEMKIQQEEKEEDEGEEMDIDDDY